MNELFESMNRIDRRCAEDAWRFAESDGDLCMLCGAYGTDKRSLFISCLYDVSEAVPEALNLRYVPGLEARGWYVRLCKSCRGSLLGQMREWRNERVALRGMVKDHDGYVEEADPERCISVRVDGMCVMMLEHVWEEWRRKQEGKETYDASGDAQPVGEGDSLPDSGAEA